MTILNVAEKNSVSKQVSNILSRGTKRYQRSLCQWAPLYKFKNDNGDQMIFTAVKGHIITRQLPPQTAKWASYDNKKILNKDQTHIITKISKDNQTVVQNLQVQARRASQLILWLDCDRQGQAIAFQVIQICQRVNKKIKIYRARFAALTSIDIWNAYNNLVNPNKRQADAVNYRSQIDFRLGCAFSRFQTLAFQKKYFYTNKLVLSYGPCQMPTLGFVVQRYLQIKYFKSQPFWMIKCFYYPNQYFKQQQDKHQNKKNKKQLQFEPIQFKWQRKNTKDQYQVHYIFNQIFKKFPNGQIIAKIKNRNINPKKRYRPYPLTTISLQKLGTDKLRISSGRLMQIAQKLYHKGFISYPRTQTNSFPKTMNLKELIKRIETIPQYQNYIQDLIQNGKYLPPKAGKNDDNAHSPIHPVKKVNQGQLTQQQWRVYDLICRHFLACCSKDAIGQQFQVIADIGGQKFKASYLTIKQRNYLQIYPYDKWNQSHFGNIPNQFQPFIYIHESKTTPPGYLTQGQLITLLQKNHIGTDATLHQHIKTIQDRQYAIKQSNTFKPTQLGVGLVIAYKKCQIGLHECIIRRIIQQNMDKIANGQLSLNNGLVYTLDMMIPIFQKLKSIQQQWIINFKQGMRQNINLKAGQYKQRDGNQSNGGSFYGNSNIVSNINHHHNNQDNDDDNDDNNRGGGMIRANNNNNNNQYHNNNNQNNNKTKLRCYKCNQQGHFANQCPKNNNKRQIYSLSNNSDNYKNKNKDKNQNTNTNQKQKQYSLNNKKNQKVNKKSKKNYNTKKQNNNNTLNTLNTLNNYNFIQNNYGNSINNNITCYKCNQKGHYANNCPLLKGNTNNTNNNTNNHFQNINQNYLQNNKKQIPFQDQNLDHYQYHHQGQNNFNHRFNQISSNLYQINNHFDTKNNQFNINIKNAGINNNQRQNNHINYQNYKRNQQQQQQHQHQYKQRQQINNTCVSRRIIGLSKQLSSIEKFLMNQMSKQSHQAIKCSCCYKFGHTIRTCPMKPDKQYSKIQFLAQEQNQKRKNNKKNSKVNGRRNRTNKNKQNHQRDFNNNNQNQITYQQRNMMVSFVQAGTYNFQNNFNDNNNSIGNNNKKICTSCGHQGKHPKGSTCPTIRRNKQKSKQQKNLSKVDQLQSQYDW